ncbi:MAG: Gfo/Idh/MocA family protein [Pseudomonadota bacterium]
MNPSRRSVLGAAGAAAAATAATVSGAAGAAQPETGRKAGWAVLGLGRHAELSLSRLAPTRQTRLAALISGSPDKLSRIGDQYGVPPSARYGYGDWDRIAKDPSIDVVYVVTPVGTHADFAIQALRAGKHVLVEKTMAESSDRCRQMIAEARRAGRKLGVAYRAWHDPVNRFVMQARDQAGLGPLRTLSAHKGFVMQLPAGDWRFDPRLGGGGALVDIGIYSLQASRYAAGEEPVEVQALASSDPDDPRYRTAEQTIAWTARFPSGAWASCTASWDYTGQNTLRAAFRDGFVELDPATLGANNRLYVGRRRDGAFGIEERMIASPDQIAAQFDHFSRAVLDDTAPMTDGVEGLKDVLAIEAIYRAVKSGRAERVAPVQL